MGVNIANQLAGSYNVIDIHDNIYIGHVSWSTWGVHAHPQPQGQAGARMARNNPLGAECVEQGQPAEVHNAARKAWVM